MGSPTDIFFPVGQMDQVAPILAGMRIDIFFLFTYLISFWLKFSRQTQLQLSELRV